MLEPCDQLPGHLRLICRGEHAPVSLEASNAYRANGFNGMIAPLPPLPAINGGRSIPHPTMKAYQPAPLVETELPPGPGTELKKLFDSLGIAVHGVQQSGCGACRALMDRMNTLGPDGCRREAAAVAAELRERAKMFDVGVWGKAAALAVVRGILLNPLSPFTSLVELAVRNAEAKIAQIDKTTPAAATTTPQIGPIATVPSPKTPISAKTPTWAYGVITTPHRLMSHLPQTIASLRASGFDTPILGVDGAQDSAPWRAIAQQVVTRWPARGNFANWWLTAQEVYLSNPHAEMYAMFEDDLIISAGAREYLERTCTEDEVYYNLYTFPENQRRASAEYTGWFDSNQRGLGAVGLVFRRDPFLKLLSTAGMLHHAADPIRGKERVDGIVVSAFTNYQIVERCHTPSIIQHTGDVSVLKHGKFPKATSFRGEAFNLTSLIR